MTEDIFLAQILGHKLLGAAALSVGQSYNDFYVVESPANRNPVVNLKAWMGLGAVLLAESPGRSLFRSLGGFSSENDLCYADR